jgi:hypothetical protein
MPQRRHNPPTPGQQGPLPVDCLLPPKESVCELRCGTAENMDHDPPTTMVAMRHVGRRYGAATATRQLGNHRMADGILTGNQNPRTARSPHCHNASTDR